MDSAEKNKIFLDPSLFFLLASNLFAIGVALWLGWNPAEVLWVFWGQSVIIGCTNFVRMVRLKEFATTIEIDKAIVPSSKAAQVISAVFFLFHYGFFHVGYMVFINENYPFIEIDKSSSEMMLVCAAAFACAHIFSLKYNSVTDFKNHKPNIGTFVIYPYLRIVPMHVIAAAGATIATASWFLIFMVLKTFADCVMHIIEHHLFRARDLEVT